MGSQFGLAPEPFGWHKWKLGWLNHHNVACVGGGNPAPDETRYTLRPLAAPAREEGGHPDLRAGGRTDPEGTRLVVLRTGGHRALAMEIRDREGNDKGLCSKGLLLYRVKSDTPSTHGPVEVVDGHPGSGNCRGSSVHPQLADAPLEVGESWADPHDGIRVEVTGRTSDGDWEIKVTRG
jgi:hypothetical protein